MLHVVYYIISFPLFKLFLVAEVWCIHYASS